MKILVPIDGSGYSLKAVEYAAEFAKKYDAQVDLLYVIVYEANFMDSAMVVQKLGEQAAEQALSSAEETFAAKNADVKPNRIIETGSSAANVIINMVAKQGYDGIMMGSKGKSNMERFLVGSVSNRVILHAPCTVTLVR
ncbi:MAG: universal stress protein [Anaerovoracaceae bacterium]|jgi:nucleotide-binding universal stress UspA family protein